MSTHFITKCSCGQVISQCRCPSPGKKITVIDRGCELCHNSHASVTYDNGGWLISDHTGKFIRLSQDDWKFVENTIHEHYHGED